MYLEAPKIGDKILEIDKQQTAFINTLLDVFYPVGVIFEATSTISPAETMGGTWERYGNGRVTVGLDSSSDFNTIGKTGGEKTHKLTINEMPSHGHALNRVNTSGNGTRNAAQWGWSNSTPTTAFMSIEGDDEPHNNLQPYIVVYRWRRIA